MFLRVWKIFLIISEIKKVPSYDKNKQENDRKLKVEFDLEGIIYTLLSILKNMMRI